MKIYHLAICCFLFLAACQKIDHSQTIEIDLDQTAQSINYSTFVESVESTMLHLGDSLPINGVDRLLFDRDRIFVKDSGHEGIFIFDKESGQLLKRLGIFGEGPEEIKRIGALCLDTVQKQLCVFDKGDMRIKRYDYSGNYISSIYTEDFFLDMVNLGNEGMVYFYPIYTGDEQPCGVWSADSANHLKKRLHSHITEECRFHYFPMMYNWDGTCAYYYDRNWDELFRVTADSLALLQTFHLKQGIPLAQKGNLNISPKELDGHSIVHHFAYSDHFLLMSFHTFHQNDMSHKDITWMLYDLQSGDKIVSKSLKNDIAPNDEINGYSLFYKDSRTWVRVDDSLDNSIRLEYLHLRS